MGGQEREKYRCIHYCTQKVYGTKNCVLNCYDFHFDQVLYHLEAVTTKCLMCVDFHKHVRNQEQHAIQSIFRHLT